MSTQETVRLLMIEDFLPTVDGLRSWLEGGEDGETPRITVLSRFLTTTEDAVAFFEGAARHGDDALRGLALDAVLVDGFMPRDAQARHPDFAAVEIAIRVTAIYDRAGIDDRARPRMILTTADPDPCDVRAFVAFGGAGVVEKTSLAPEELRRRIAAIVAADGPPAFPAPDLPHTYQASFGRYLPAIELGVGNQAAADRIGATAESLTRVKNELRRAFDLPQRASDREIADAAKARGVTWIPLRHEDVAKQYGVRPRVTRW